MLQEALRLYTQFVKKIKKKIEVDTKYKIGTELSRALNLKDPMKESLGLDLVPNNSIDHKVSCILSNSFGFGGTNASLIIKSI